MYEISVIALCPFGANRIIVFPKSAHITFLYKNIVIGFFINSGGQENVVFGRSKALSIIP